MNAGFTDMHELVDKQKGNEDVGVSFKNKVINLIRSTFKLLVMLIIPLITTHCGKSNKKAILLKANRRAPLGWVNLSVYTDSTFEFTVTGMRSISTEHYPGKVEIRNDSLFFEYTDSVPDAGKTAVFSEKMVAYIDGKYAERLQINQSNLNSIHRPSQ